MSDKKNSSDSIATENSSYSNNYSNDIKPKLEPKGRKSCLRQKTTSLGNVNGLNIKMGNNELHVGSRVYEDHSNGRADKVYLCTDCLCKGKRVEAKITVAEEEHCEDCEYKTLKRKNHFQEDNSSKKVKFDGK